MDSIRKGLAQFGELFQSMTPAARITAGLLLGVIVISLAFLFQYNGQSGDTYLFGGREFSQSDLAAMSVAFAENGLNSGEIVGNRMRVPSTQRDLYLKSLTHMNLSNSPKSMRHEMLQNPSSFMIDNNTRKQRLALSKDVEAGRLLEQLRDVEKAEVSFDVYEEGGLRGRRKVRATAVVTGMGGRPLRSGLIHTIRQQLHYQRADLDLDDISVTDATTGEIYYGNHVPGGVSMYDDPYVARQKYYEEEWANKIADLHRHIPGFRVEVRVDLEREVNSNTETVQLDQPVAIETTEKTENRSTSTPQNSGPPGPQSNQVEGNTAASVATTTPNQDTVDKTDSTNKNVAGRTVIQSTKVGLVPVRALASVQVPRDYAVTRWRRQNPTPDGEEPREPTEDELNSIKEEIRGRIQESIVPMLAKTEKGENPYPDVNVDFYDEGLPLPVSSAGIGGGVVSWLATNWQTLAMFAFGFVCLFMFRSTLASVGGNDEAADIGSLLPSDTAGDSETDEDESDVPRVLQLPDSGPDLRQELTDLVKQNPDAAANVLRDWIGEAA